MRGLAEDMSIIIRPADKGSCVLVWDRADNLAEAENHLSDGSTYKEVKFEEEELENLLSKVIGCLSNFFRRKVYPLKNTYTSVMVLKSQPI